MTIEAKFCVESDLTGPDAAICRNLEDYSDSISRLGFSDASFCGKQPAAEAGIPFNGHLDYCQHYFNISNE